MMFRGGFFKAISYAAAFAGVLLRFDRVSCCVAAEKASIYTYPGAVLPVLNPLMRVLAYYFPDDGIKRVIFVLFLLSPLQRCFLYKELWGKHG